MTQKESVRLSAVETSQAVLIQRFDDFVEQVFKPMCKKVNQIALDVQAIQQNNSPKKKNSGNRFWQSEIFMKVLDKTFSFGWKIALLIVIGKEAVGL